MVKKAIVLKAPGTNNDYETCHALNSCGADAEIVHINELANKSKKLNDYAVLVIPGGFSYGDDLGAGRVFSLFLEYKLRGGLRDFIKSGRIVLGICNGFQVLVKSKVLPDTGTEQKATLGFNESGMFVCRWVRLRIKNSGLFWFKGIPEEIELPVAHAEGRFAALPGVEEDLKKKHQIALTYTDNPNGSQGDIAGIVNEEGNVLGLMPHPERFFYSFQHPGSKSMDITPWGRMIFKNIIKNA